jgi:hypothetical protein
MYCSCGRAAICRPVGPLLLPQTVRIENDRRDVFTVLRVKLHRLCSAQPTSAPFSFSGRDSHTVKVMVLSGSKTLLMKLRVDGSNHHSSAVTCQVPHITALRIAGTAKTCVPDDNTDHACPDIRWLVCRNN